MLQTQNIHLFLAAHHGECAESMRIRGQLVKKALRTVRAQRQMDEVGAMGKNGVLFQINGIIYRKSYKRSLTFPNNGQRLLKEKGQKVLHVRNPQVGDDLLTTRKLVSASMSYV